MKKSLVGLLLTTVMLLSLAAPLIAIPTVAAADPSDWYMTSNGVLGSDYYWLYPYENKSLKVGFSKFGEMINSEANVGLEYNSAVDPFAYPTGSSISTTVPKRMWVQGWYINISYVHRTLGERSVWAGALHSDTILFGNDWIRVDLPNDWTPTYGWEDFRDPGYFINAVPYATTLVQGGRKTNGTCVTNPIEVLYDGPREFIAVCRTTIYDHLVFLSNSTDSDVALLQLAITVRFDKVKKCVVLYKDLKSLLVEKEGIKMKIQFSNRGEVDLGTATVGISAYAHFWTEGTGPRDNAVEGLQTVYDADWQLIQTEDPQDTEYPGCSAAGPFPQVDATFDYAQAINPLADYAWSAAFWPSLSDWSIDGWDQWWHSLTALDPHYIDYRIPADEPYIPFYIGEWDFVLYHTLDSMKRTQFRGVTQYAVTHLHDGDDVNIDDPDLTGSPYFLGKANVVDSEMMYYLDETFNPWDLVDAVHKDTDRWVEWKTSTSTSYTTTRTECLFVPVAKWNDYCTFAEKVIRLDTGALLQRSSYGLSLTADGKLAFTGLPTAKCKILFSTKTPKLVVMVGDAPSHSAPSMLSVFGFGYGGDPGRDEVMFTKDDLDYAPVVYNAAAMGISVLAVDYGATYAPSEANFNFMATNTGGANYNATLLSTKWNESIISFIKSRFGTSKMGDVVFVVDLSGSMGGSTLLADVKAKLTSIVNASYSGYDLRFGVGSFVDYPHNYTSYGYSDEYGDPETGDYAWKKDQALTNNGTLVDQKINGLITCYGGDTPQDYARALYEAQMAFDWRVVPGRYEWVEVGRSPEAATVDSAGAALVAETFDSVKHIDIGIAGADMDNALTSNMMPFVMARFGAGTSVADYKDSIFRAALRDDWCTYWPVASSNMIGIGGPLANMLAYYANDFTDAFYGLSDFSGTAYKNTIAPISCWNRNWPTSTRPYNTYPDFNFPGFGYFGYAVISTYKDINGTVLFNVWGNQGRDTYYASLWLHGDEARGFTPGIIEMQRLPKGATSIVLGIVYQQSDPTHPLYYIPELLGTISETGVSAIGETDGIAWYMGTPWDVKGGIHDP